MEHADPSGCDWVHTAADISAGWGDALTFGMTGRIRMWIGCNGGDAVRQHTGAYLGGMGLGIANDALMGGALVKSAAKGLGKVAAKVAPRAAEAAVETSRGFRSFSAFKRATGAAGEGRQWHHIVEARNAKRFGAEVIHNTENLVNLSTSIHRKVSAFYSSKQVTLTGRGFRTIREWMNTLDYASQRKYGKIILDAIKRGKIPEW